MAIVPESEEGRSCRTQGNIYSVTAVEIEPMLISLAQTDLEIQKCFPVLSQLRPHLEAATFLSRVRRQQQQGYQLAFLAEADRVIGTAGFQIDECLAWGKYLYVFDLAIDGERRSSGYGGQLFQWLVDFAKQHECSQLHLDSGVQRFEAHRFYLKQRMNIASHHFSLGLIP